METNNFYTSETLEAFLTEKIQKFIAAGCFHNIDVQNIYSKGIIEWKSKTYQEQVQDDDMRLIQRFQNLQTYLKQYTMEMEKRFSCYFMLSYEKLKNFHEKASAVIDANKREDDLLQYALEEYFNQYTTRNLAIQKHESEILKSVAFPKVIKFYESEFKLHTKNISHAALKKQCIETIKRCFSYNDDHLMILQDCFQSLDKLLDEENRKMIAYLNYKEKAVQVYNKSMQHKLTIKMYTESELQNLHQSCSLEAAKYMRQNIECSQEEQTSFQSTLEKLYEAIKAENQQFITAPPKPTQHFDTRQPPNTQQFLNNQVKSVPSRQNVDFLPKNPKRQEFPPASLEISPVNLEKPSVPSKQNAFVPQNIPKRQENPPTHLQLSPLLSETPPIIAIEFNPVELRSGIIINDKLILIPLDFEKTLLSTDVGLSANNRVLIGSQMLQGYKTKFHLKEMMELKFPLSNAQPANFFTCWNREVNAKKELLIALLFSEVKRKAQIFLKRSIDNVVISVPLRYTTTERQAIKESATISGFKNISLITETTASAIAYYEKCKKDRDFNAPVNKRGAVLTIVANAGQYDMALYGLSERNNIVMIECAGNLHSTKNRIYQEILSHLRNFPSKPTHIQNIVCVGLRDPSKAVTLKSVPNCEIPNAVLFGAAQYAASLTRSTPISFVDVLPYEIKIKKRINNPGCGICGSPSLTRFKRGTLLNGNQNNSWVQRSATVCLDVSERGVQEIRSGSFKIDTPGSKRLTAHLNSEGILTICANTGEAEWNRSNLNPTEKQDCISFVKVESKCREIDYLANEFSERLNELHLHEILQLEIMDQVTSSLELLNKNNISDAAVDASLEMLKGLNEKYFRLRKL